MPNVTAFILIILGYGLLYTGIMDFSGHNIGLFQAFGYTGSKGPSINTSQYTWQNPVANMSGQPAQQTSGSPVSGVQGV